MALTNAMTFDGKVALVTGAAGNLGRAVGAAFHASGANVVLVDIDAGALNDAYGPSAERRLLLAADLIDEASIASAVQTAREKFGRIDILCNIAGGFASGPPVHETPASIWQRMFDLNAMSVVNTVKAAVPGMIERKAGNIINVAAAASIRGQPNMAAYGVAKNAVVRLTESMAAELRPHGICVCCVMPTIIDTPQNRTAMPDADTSGWTPPSSIADVILFLASDDAMIMSGCAIRLSGRPRR
ncbi:MAG TPA: SDR family NAD(P)-dependent oxidoreductase [Casimicrobiaceae bacterium]|jgi:NAD(P)-dependent dehydrogenase (short-subunit alcohol dehydrogenase family)